MDDDDNDDDDDLQSYLKIFLSYKKEYEYQPCCTLNYFKIFPHG